MIEIFYWVLVLLFAIFGYRSPDRPTSIILLALFVLTGLKLFHNPLS